jgi:hypothetical protein
MKWGLRLVCVLRCFVAIVYSSDMILWNKGMSVGYIPESSCDHRFLLSIVEFYCERLHFCVCSASETLVLSTNSEVS